MRIACWIPKATNTGTQYVIIIALSLQQWLHERDTVLPYMSIACLVKTYAKWRLYNIYIYKGAVRTAQ
jgi:hypothetical protein